MNKRQTLLAVTVGVLVLGSAGLLVTSVVDYFLRPRTPAEVELEQTKKMLREGFEKNKALVAQNKEIDEKLLRLLTDVQERDKEIESLRRQLEDQVTLVRKMAASVDREPLRRVLKEVLEDRARSRWRYQRKVGGLKDQIAASAAREAGWAEEAARQKEYSAALEDELEMQILRLEEAEEEARQEKSLREREEEEKEKMKRLAAGQAGQKDAEEAASLRQKWEDERKRAARLEESLKQGTLELEELKKKGEGSSDQTASLRRRIAKEYLGTIEDLLKRIEELKKAKGDSSVIAGSAGGNIKEEKNAIPAKAGIHENGSPIKSFGDDKESTASLRRELEAEREGRRRDRVTFFYNLGVVYTHYQLYKEAAEIYEKALKIDPADASVHYNLAILYDEHLRQPKKALEHYQTFLSLNKDPEKARRVENWIRLARSISDKSSKGRGRSSRESVEHMLLTPAG